MRGMRGSTSAIPMTEMSSAGASASSPAARSRGPPTPKAWTPGLSRCSSSSARAACRSALASPATMRISSATREVIPRATAHDGAAPW